MLFRSLVYNTVKDLIQNDHKISQYTPTADAQHSYLELYKDKLDRLGIPSHLHSTTFQFVQSIQELYDYHVKRGQAKVHLKSPNLVHEMHVYQYHTQAATCHIVEQSFEESIVYSVFFYGLLRDRMLTITNILQESGIYSWWYKVVTASDASLEEVRKMRGYREPELASPVSFDWKIMQIFPACACLLAFTSII